MSGIVDFHSHILPGIDDGSACVEESIAMLQMEAEQGIRHVVATPHFYARHDTPERFLARRQEAEAQLREAAAMYDGLPQISVGAEVYFFPGISESSALAGLTIDQKRCILIEMPNSPWTDSMYGELEAIQVKRGITPIIAHVDRYIRPFRTYRIPERLEELPVLVQANANFFLHSSTRRMALKMLRKGQIQLLGSDCHNLTTRRPNLGDAIGVIQRNVPNEIIRQVPFYQDDVLFD